MVIDNDHNNVTEVHNEKPAAENWKMILIFGLSLGFIVALAIFEASK